MTEARVLAVMQKVSANFQAFVVARYVDKEKAQSWAQDITYLQLEAALEFFEIQLTPPTGAPFGLRYTVRADGSIQQDSASGGLDIYGFPAGTRAGLFAHLRTNTPRYVYDELKKRGWGINGKKLDGAESEGRAFSSGGYGLTRSKLGTWP
jgi:hypothetical protein